MANLITGLGGDAGFGENFVPRNDDGSTGFIDLSAIFPNGLNFFGTTYTGFYINNNGGVTFNSARSQFTPSSIVSNTNNPEIVAFYADVDTRGPAGNVTPGGTSQGTNLVWFDLDAANNTIIITYDDVGYYSSHTNLVNAFQIVISDASGDPGRAAGDFNINFRYEDINWTTGDASSGSGGLGGVVARAGFSAGFGQANAFFELPQSGDQTEMLALETSLGNTGMPGLWTFEIRNGEIPSTISVYALDPREPEGDEGQTTTVTFELIRSGDVTTEITTQYVIAGSGANPANDADFEVFPHTGTITFAPGQTRAYIEVPIHGDNVIEPNELFTVTLTNLSGPLAGYGQQQASTFIVDDDGVAPPLPPLIFSTGWGDPHLTTLDGLHYDFQAAGEFVLARSTDGSGFEVQIRTTPINDAVSVISAVGALMDGHQISYTASTNSLMIDGVATVIDPLVGSLAVGSGIIYLNSDGSYRFDFPGLAQSLAVVDQGGYLDVTLGAAAGAQLEGLLGDFDGNGGNDLSNPGGSITYDPTNLTTADFFAFADGWRITDATSLFDYGPGESTATFTDTSFPQSSFTLADFPPDLVAAARAAATAAGITDPVLRDSAALDYLLTGDPSFLESGATAEAPTTEAEIVDGATPQAIGIGREVAGQDERDAGATNFAFVIYRTDGDGELTVDWNVVAGSADASDFVGGLPSGQVTFADGETEITINVEVQGDTAAEFDETFSVAISTTEPGVLVVAPSISSTILNDDGAVPATLTLSAVTPSVTEGDAGTTTYTFAVTRTGDTTGATTLDVQLGVDLSNPDAADLLTDFSGLTSVAVSFAAGETYKEVSFSVAGDLLVEADEFFFAEMDNIVGGVAATATPVGGQILNDDVSSTPPPVLAIAADAASQPEGDAGATAFTFTVTRTGDLTGASSASYTVTGPGANAGDFTGALSGQVDFAAGEDSATITVLVDGDTTFEGNEVFTVTLSAPVDATIGTASAQSTITNDDIAPPASGIITLTRNADTITYAGSANGVHVKAGNGDDDVTGSAHDDQFNGGQGDDRLQGKGGDDKIGGGLGDDLVGGGDGNDQLTGGEGDDHLTGGAGNDRLRGSEGKDRLSGGLGADEFVFSASDGASRDTVVDFVVGEDFIVLEGALSIVGVKAVDGNNVLLTLSNGGTVFFKDVTLGLLGDPSFKLWAGASDGGFF